MTGYISPALAFKQRINEQLLAYAARLALENNNKARTDDLAKANDTFGLLLVQLENDLKRVSSLPQGSARVELKRELLKTYLPGVDAYLTGNEIFANPVFVECLIWAFDVADIELALRLANAALEQNQPMPKRFNKRNLQTFIADAVIEWVAGQRAEGKAIQPYFGTMHKKVKDWPIHDVIKMQYCKVAAAEAEKAGNDAAALALYQEAVKLDPKKAQCKTAIEQLEKRLAKAAADKK